MMGYRSVAVAGLMAAGLAAAPASACSLAPPAIKTPPIPAPGVAPADSAAVMTAWNIIQRSHREVTERDATIWRQRQMFDRAESVVLARVDRTGLGGAGDAADAEGLVHVMLKPLRWLKGQGEGREFRLGATGLTSCGPVPEFDAIQGQPGEVFLIYLEDNVLDQASVTGTLAVARITEARTLAALDVALN